MSTPCLVNIIFGHYKLYSNGIYYQTYQINIPKGGH